MNDRNKDRNFKNLEVGCYYLNVPGELFGPIKKNDCPAFEFKANRMTFNRDGDKCNPHTFSDDDLITKVNVTITPFEAVKKKRKFKVGDKVKVVRCVPGLEYLYLNKELFIDERQGDYYRLTSQTDFGFYTLQENWLELAEPEIELFVGAVVKTRHGVIDMIVSDSMALQEGYYHTTTKKYNKSGIYMAFQHLPKLDIVEILNKKTY